MAAWLEILGWLDAVPARFWTGASLLMAATTWLAVAWRARRAAGPAPWWTHPACFAFMAVLTVVAFRWPAWFQPAMINPDECQTIAGAITLAEYPVYWRDVDGTTHGPWSEYFLLLAHWLGAPLDYVTARAVATLLQALTALAPWLVVRPFTDERTARLASLPTVAFWAFVSWDDFVHYSSELPALFFLAVAASLLAPVLAATRVGRAHQAGAYAAGFALGAVPFAKLQAVPLGLAIAGIGGWLLWRRREWLDASQRGRLGAWLLAGGLTVPAAVAVGLTVAGLWPQFLAAYLDSALAYTALTQHPPIQGPAKFLHFSATSTAFAFFFWGSLVFAVLHARTRSTDSRHAAARAITWGLLLVAFYCVLRPGREAAHYLQLLIGPLGWLSAFALAAAVAEKDRDRTTRLARLVVPVAWALLTIAPQVYDRATSWNRFVGYLAEHRAQPPPETARFLRAEALPGDRAALWGWEPHLLVRTGLPQGTREAHTAMQLTDWRLREFYTHRYLADLRANRPRWFIDVVGPGSFMFEHRGNHAHESVPALRDWIAAHYVLVREIGSHRIYRLRPAGA